MKVRLFLICACSVFILVMEGCKKDQYQTNPQITIESINTIIPVDGSMQATLKFTQKDGKLGQGIFTAIRVRLNQDPLPPGTEGADTLVGAIPQFPDQNQGELDFTLDYSYLHQSDTENDTIMFKFAVLDRVGNKSDTISSEHVVVLSQ